MRVYIILFNARTENEGVHSLKIGNHNTVLMFQNEDDATRFALMLEAQDFPPATIEGIDSEEVEEFCASAGYECQLIDEQMLAMPPENNVEEMDWSEDGKQKAKASRDDGDFNNDELERIRRQLENLL
jgi:hypothetical protein